MATFKHISSKNADYGAAEQYLTFEHDEFTMKPTLDGNGQLVIRDDYRISSLNCGEEDFAIACMRSNMKYGKNQKREDVKSHHYIISFDPRTCFISILLRKQFIQKGILQKSSHIVTADIHITTSSYIFKSRFAPACG